MIRFKYGWVHSKADVSQTGEFKVIFDLSDLKGGVGEPVTYVSPYGSKDAAFVAIPEPGSKVIVAWDDEPSVLNALQGYHYMGSIMGATPFSNINVPVEDENIKPSEEYIPKIEPGTHGPSINYPALSPKTSYGTFPPRFSDMYKAKGVVPEAIGLTNARGDALKIASRYNSTKRAQDAYQDYAIGIMSGSGKRIQAVDTPIVNGIVMANEHRGKDFFIWSSGGSDESPFSAGEYHMRTHGPVNLYTLHNRFHIWVEDGLNIDIENKSTPRCTYGPGLDWGPDGQDFVGPFNGGAGLPLVIDPGEGGPLDYPTNRQGEFGNETTGCIKFISHYNNISASALATDSVIHVHAPGARAKVIVETGGTVDIVADKKITLQSNTEVEINAPIVDINAVTATTITAPLVDIDGSDEVDIDGSIINLN